MLFSHNEINRKILKEKYSSGCTQKEIVHFYIVSNDVLIDA